ncbi:MAG: single-stranded DNA-binding protein [Helicobacteraceae bacterium]|nr:single-stranded DNA-binding protein [Helicobacteraceae bacterium]
MFNKIIIVGNLTRDVELKYLPSGSAVATLGLASNRRYKKQDGSQVDEVCFVDVELFGRTAEVANQYLKKGSQILIEGRLTFRIWSDQSGAKRSKHTITAESMQMLGSKNQTSNDQGSDYGSGGYENSYGSNYGGTNEQSYSNSQNSQVNSPKVPEIDIDEDEIPF